MLPAGDGELIRIMDAALADSTARSGAWLACRPGCSQCCTGVFRIGPLDRERLREGLRLAEEQDPAKAARIRARVYAAQAKLKDSFPGDPATGVLHEDDERFEDFANDEVCPVLDPSTQTCDLYSHRPMTCRSFGPPVRTEDDCYGVCELCFVGAPESAVAHAQLHLPDPAMELKLERETGVQGTTVVAFALLTPPCEIMNP